MSVSTHARRRQPGWIRTLSPLIGRRRHTLALVIVATGIGQSGIAAAPVITMIVIDDVLLADRRALAPLIAALIGIAAVIFAAGYVRRYYGGMVALEITRDLRQNVFEHVQGLDAAQHDRLATGQLISRSSADISMILSLLNSMPLVIGNIFMLSAQAIVMTLISPALAAIMVCAAAVLVLAGLRLREVMLPAAWDAQQHHGEIATVVEDSVAGVRVVKGFGQESRELDRFAAAALSLYRSQLRVIRLQASFTAILGFVPLLAQAAVLALGGWLAIRGSVSVGAFLAFATYTVQMVGPLRSITNLLALAQQVNAAVQRVFEILAIEPTITSPAAPAAPPVTVPHVRFDAVGFSYGSKSVLRETSISIEPGETVAVLGRSGSGKSTLANLMVRLYDPNAGSVSLDGIDVRDLALSDLRALVGVVSQDVTLFSGTIADNIAVGVPSASAEQIAAAAHIAGAATFIDALPEGYQSRLGERGVGLSGGQRQRIAIARAVLLDPSVLILDDATSALDASTEAMIISRLGQLPGQRTMIIISHRPAIVERADQVIVFHDGQAVASAAASRDLLETLFTEPPTESAHMVAELDSTASAWPYERASADDSAGNSGDLSRGTFQAQRRGGMGGLDDVAGGVVATADILMRVRRLPPAMDEPGVSTPRIGEDPPERLVALARPFSGAIALAVVLLVADTAAMLLGPALTRYGIDSGVMVSDASPLLWAAAGLVAIAASDLALTRGYLWITGRTTERILYSLRLRLFAHLQSLSLDYFESQSSGWIMTRLTSDVDAQSRLVQNGLVNAIISALTLVGVSVWLVVLSPQMSIVLVLVAPLIVVSSVVYRRLSQPAYERARDDLAQLNTAFQEDLGGYREMRLFRADGRASTRFAELNNAYLHSRLQSQRVVAVYFPFLEFLATVAPVMVFITGAHLVAGGVISTGTVLAFLLYLSQFFAPMQQLSLVLDTWQQASVSLRRMETMMASKTSTPTRADPIAVRAMSEGITLRGTEFRYGAGPAVLHALDLTVPLGSTIAVVGETGSGKSTLVKLIARFYDPTSGSVLRDQIDLRDVNLREFRRTVAVAAQESFLFGGSVADNIRYGVPSASDQEVEAAARAAGVHELVASFEMGYLTIVGERGAALSAGERQLVALARVRLANPELLLIDEATAHLDPIADARVRRATAGAAVGSTTIMVAHRLSTAAAADLIVVMADGRVVELGTFDELQAQRGEFARLWRDFQSLQGW